MNKIPFNKPYMTGKELWYISQAHHAGQLAGDGQYTKKCHQWLESQTSCHKALLTHSCTAALEMSAILAELKPGDEVIMPSYTFVSTANAFVLRGAVPVFIDIRPDTLNLLDPLLVQSYRGDRLDCWVIAVCLGVCWLLRIAIKNFSEYQLCFITVGLSGSLSVVAMFIWPSAVILYPLILLELSSLLYIHFKKQANFQNSLKLLFVFGFSGIITVIL
ncbi:MAG: aminotransferase class I/II-fold pyridoxal phosphate-dependent enzyme, partial [Dolichospermum sp.]